MKRAKLIAFLTTIFMLNSCAKIVSPVIDCRFGPSYHYIWNPKTGNYDISDTIPFRTYRVNYWGTDLTLDGLPDDPGMYPYYTTKRY